MIQKYLLIAALVTLAGCSKLWTKPSSTQGSAASGSTTSQPQAQSSGSKSSWMSSKFSDLGGKAPAMDPTRKINEQDCTTGGVDFTAGNLRCK